MAARLALFELVISLLLAGAFLVVWSRHIGVPYPALLSLAGAAAALIPGTPDVVLEPELTLALFVAPTLLDAAFDASLRDIRDNWVPIGALAVIVVALTVAAVAVLVRALVPGMPWSAAVALGAIVAPPDASAATTVLRQLRPPHRLMVILEGESLLNDAMALMIYRIAVAGAGGSALGWHLAPELVLTAGGGGLLGWLLARLWIIIPLHRTEIAISVLVQFLGTFAVWILADRLGVSAIITVVVYAMTIARGIPSRMSARHRIASYAVWDVVVFVLNVLAFVLIGLQLKAILARLDGGWAVYAETAAAIFVAIILVRIAWVMSHNIALRWKIRRFGEGPGRKLMQPSAAGGILISWCGMRGIVTLASALALPQDFSHRDLIVFCAFWIVLGTLVLQGLTLRPLLQWLDLPSDTSVEAEIHLARQATASAAIKALEAHEGSEAAAMLRREYAARAAGVAEATSPSGALAELQSHVVVAQRRLLIELRDQGTIGDDAFHAIEEELDIIELTADPRVRSLDVQRE